MENLSNRERQIVELIAMGMRNKEVARTLNLTEGTIKVRCVNIYRKLKVKNRTSLALLYHQATSPKIQVRSLDVNN